MKVKIRSCPICDSDILKPFETISTDLGSIEYDICQTCGMVFQVNQMDESQLLAFYGEGYRTLYQETEEPTKKDLVMQEQRARQAIRMIEDDLDAIERHIDIGSSGGELLLHFQEAYGCVSVGIEPGRAYRNFSEERGLEVFESLDAVPDDIQAFDFLSMMHVLEHLPDPVKFLSDLREKHLTENAYLLVEVPNLLEHQALELAHLYAFTPRTLQETVRQSGFEVLWTRSHGGFRSPIINLYITLLARALPGSGERPAVQSTASGIGLRRKLGKIKGRLFTRLLPDWTWQSPPSLWDSEDQIG